MIVSTAIHYRIFNVFVMQYTISIFTFLLAVKLAGASGQPSPKAYNNKYDKQHQHEPCSDDYTLLDKISHPKYFTPRPYSSKYKTPIVPKFPTPAPSKFPTPAPSKFPTPAPSKFPTLVATTPKHAAPGTSKKGKPSKHQANDKSSMAKDKTDDNHFGFDADSSTGTLQWSFLLAAGIMMLLLF